ncbi:Fic family protein, partial [Cryobacterium melibiosiphilum]
MATFDEKLPWAPTGYEERPWRSVQDDYGSRTQKRLASGPYLASVPAFIADLDIPLSSELHAVTEEAASELARFDAEVGQIAAPFA